jgi:hypothetical protein
VPWSGSLLALDELVEGDAEADDQDAGEQAEQPLIADLVAELRFDSVMGELRLGVAALTGTPALTWIRSRRGASC